MATPKEYQKLPGSGTRFEGARWIAGIRKSCTLWRGSDHLLLILATGYEQEFKRFYFRDIQAITVRRTGVGKAISAVLFGFTALFIWAAMVSSPPGGVIFGIIAAIFGLFAIIDIWRGPTCITELKTAVQQEELSSLKRVRTAEKTLSLLRPHIEQAQGTLSAEEVQFQMENIPPVYAAAGATARVSHPSSKPLKSCSGRLHQILFALLILDGLMNALGIFVHPVALLAVGTFVSLGMAAVMITALIQQHQSDISKSLRRITWVTCGYVVVSYFIATITGTVLSMTNPSSGADEWNMLRAYAEIDPLTTPWLLTLLVVSAIVSLVLGLMGSIMTFRFRDRKLHPPVPPAISTGTDLPVR